MSSAVVPQYSGSSGQTDWIRRLRPDLQGTRRALSVDQPAGWLGETEPDASGNPRSFLTVFLTNRECPWHCLMCDLWRQTTLETVPEGAITRQLRAALDVAPKTDGLKVYNAGSFFDTRAIPIADHPALVSMARTFGRLVVECHPKLVGPRVERFAAELGATRLEVALGLECVHPEVLARLNKGMTVQDFQNASRRLRNSGIDVRAFVLVKPPFLGNNEAVSWAIQSAKVAFEAGAGVVSLIPTRGGNGALEELSRMGHFAEPTLELLEDAVDGALSLGLGRVFADLWDLERFGRGEPAFAQRRERLEAMNLGQRILPRVSG